MMKQARMRDPRRRALILLPLLLVFAGGAQALLFLGGEEMVMAAGEEIQVFGGAAPSVCDWNNDTLPDLIVGEGNSFSPGKVRIYLNVGEHGAPVFGECEYAMADGDTLMIDSVG